MTSRNYTHMQIVDTKVIQLIHYIIENIYFLLLFPSPSTGGWWLVCSALPPPCDHLQAGLLHLVPQLGHVCQPGHQLPVVRLQLRQLLVPGRPPRAHPRPVPAARQVVPPLQVSPELQLRVRSCYRA